MAITVTIDYKLLKHDDWLHVTIPSHEYFEPDTDPFDVESVPKYDHAIDYLKGVSLETLHVTRLKVSDSVHHTCRQITETFWNSGNNVIIERMDSHSDEEVYWELILDISVSVIPSIHEILRIVRKDCVVQVGFHSFIERNADGSEQEKVVYPEDGT